jgi:hypothetical protein
MGYKAVGYGEKHAIGLGLYTLSSTGSRQVIGIRLNLLIGSLVRLLFSEC